MSTSEATDLCRVCAAADEARRKTVTEDVRSGARGR